MKTKAEMEVQALKLIDLNSSLGTELVASTRRDTPLVTSVNIKAYKRTLEQGLGEARATERY